MKEFLSRSTTSSGSAISSKTSLSFTVPFSAPDNTTGAGSSLDLIPLGRSHQLTSEAWTALVNTPDRKLAANGEALLGGIEAAIDRLAGSGYDVATLPRLHAFAPEDNSLVFEWITPKFRVGFSVEDDPSDSGWYLVSTHDLGQLGFSGRLPESEARKYIPILVQFVARNT